MAVHALAAMTWTEVRALPLNSTVAILPTAAIEAHGPHLPLGTDIVIAEAMARAGAARLSARDLNVLIVPTIAFAPAPFAAAFAGTIDTPAEATTMIVLGVARSLASHGVRVTAVANAHHDPTHVEALRRAVARAAQEGGGLVFPDLTRRRWAEKLTPEFRSGACHAGRYEGSVVLAEQPDAVNMTVMQTLPPNPLSLVDAIRMGHATFAEAGGSDAYFGFPAEATADEGRQIIEALGAILEEAVMDALEVRPFDSRSLAQGRWEMSKPSSGAGDFLQVINPQSLGAPRGFSHGLLAPPGARLLFVAGQTAANKDGVVINREFTAQFDAALARVLTVVQEAGGTPAHVARMTVFVSDLDAYLASRQLLRVVWTRRMGTHFPAMALVEVNRLVDADASVEIEATAVIPDTNADATRT